MSYVLPADIVEGLNIKIENGMVVLSDKKLDCLKTKLRADSVKREILVRGYKFTNVKAVNTYSGDIYIGVRTPTSERFIIKYFRDYLFKWMDGHADWSEDRERDVYDYIIENIENMDKFDEQTREQLADALSMPLEDILTQIREGVFTRELFSDLLGDNSDAWTDVLEAIDNNDYTTKVERTNFIKIIRSCTDDELKKPVAKVSALNLVAEKGLPPLLLEGYLGVSKPKKGSKTMEKYYNKYDEIRRKQAEREEAEQSADAIAAMKAGRKTRRQRKLVARKNLHTRSRRR